MSQEDVPRLLSSDEINYVLSRLAKPQIMSSELRDHIYNQIRDIYYYQLAITKIKPSKIEKLSDYIANKSERSFYHPGMPVGFNVAESVGQPATQLVLNTFHSAGQSGTEGFERFRRNISLKNYKKNEHEFRMKVHMNDKDFSYEELYMKSQSFVTVSIKNLLDTSRLIKERYPFEDMSMYTEDFKKISNYKDKGCAIRLRFNKEKLLLHQIPLDAIAFNLEKISDDNLFTIYCGPNIDGVIDVYPNPDKICTKDNTNIKECCSIFENGFLNNKLESILLGDYPHISSATVTKLEVIKCIGDITDHYEPSGSVDIVSDTLVRVWIEDVYMKKEGIPASKIEDLLIESGYNVVDVDPAGHYLVVESSTKDIKANIAKKIKEEDLSLIEKFKETRRLHSTDLYRAAFYNIITTSGTNLAKIRNHPEIDEFNTISDSPTEIYAVFGIDVCRAYLEKEIFDLFFSNDLIIAPRNIRIMVDWMTSGIYPISVTPKSAYKKDNSILRAFCYENPRNAIIKGAVLSTTEPLSNVSARVLFGSQQTLGTGAFRVKEDPEITELYDSFKSKSSLGAFRLTSDTLRRSIGSSARPDASRISSTIPRSTRPAIPKVDDDLFGGDVDEDEVDNLSKGSSFEF